MRVAQLRFLSSPIGLYDILQEERCIYFGKADEHVPEGDRDLTRRYFQYNQLGEGLELRLFLWPFSTQRSSYTGECWVIRYTENAIDRNAQEYLTKKLSDRYDVETVWHDAPVFPPIVKRRSFR